jgi:hypothetical protein
VREYARETVSERESVSGRESVSELAGVGVHVGVRVRVGSERELRVCVCVGLGASLAGPSRRRRTGRS